MMKNIKAILGGFFAIIFLGLLAQLFYLFAGIGYFKLVKVYPSLSFLAESTSLILFAITALIAFLGGMLTAKLAPEAILINCLLVGAMAGAMTLAPALVSGYEITVNGFVLLVIFLLATVAGGLYWKKRQ